MLVNPARDTNDKDDYTTSKKDDGYALQHRKGRTIQPLSSNLQASHYTPVRPHAYAPHPAPSASSTPHSFQSEPLPHPSTHHNTASPSKDGAQAAIELIRSKVAAVYGVEPDAGQELSAAAKTPARSLSKHQQFMRSLSSSGKPLAEIQQEWHRYYTELPDAEKHEVWQEFYQASSSQPSAYTQYVTRHTSSLPPLEAAASQKAGEASTPGVANQLTGAIDPSTPAGTPKPAFPKAVVGDHLPRDNHERQQKQRTRKLTRQIAEKVHISAEKQASAKQHLRSLLFGLSTGLAVLAILLFGLFNEMVITPFIKPSSKASATPIIVNSDSFAASEEPQVIIPKINVQIPVVYGLNSIAEEVVQKGLDDGVVHYSTTVLPGQQGNSAIFGHSSNNLFNKGKYKFAFLKLQELVPGDTFHLTYNKTVYTYRVYEKRIVAPTEVSVLNNVAGKTATAALITCDPPGTSTNRLVVWGEQISPDPSGAAAPSVPPEQTGQTPEELPSEGPRLFTRFWRWLF